MSKDQRVEDRGDDDLLELLASISLDLTEQDTFRETVQRVVDLAEGLLTNCDGASLMLISKRGRMETPAYSSPTARDSDAAQYATGQGPCMDAIEDSRIVLVDDLEREQRWPDYRAQALEIGVRSMISFQLFANDDTLGALNLHSKATEAFDRRSQVVGGVFATHAAIAVKAALTEAGYETALRSRDVIGQAKGIIMARHQMTADMAFEMLRALSQERNRPVRELAQDIAETGEMG